MTVFPTDGRGARFRASAKLVLAAEIIHTTLRARLLLRAHDLPQALRILRDADLPHATTFEERLIAARLAHAVERTLFVLPIPTRCLLRSLVLSSLLSRRGIGSNVVIGVRSGPKFAAHAWVETDGVPLLPTGEGEYGRLADV